MGIYGGSYVAAGFVAWLTPTATKINSWLEWAGGLFTSASNFFS